jgi:mannitol-1-phosphate 5-dehydrogenase
MSCVVIGAGKIGRGFLGSLLAASGMRFTLVERDRTLVDRINAAGGWTVHVLGAPGKSRRITGARAVALADAAVLGDAMAAVPLAFTCVGGKNLAGLAAALAPALERRLDGGGPDLNIVTCENWIRPAAVLREAVEAALPHNKREALARSVGFVESAVLCSAIEPDAEALAKDPLAVNIQDYPHLPIDAAAVRGALPPIEGLEPRAGFEGFLERKIYTYNAANATVSYLGYLKGYTALAEAGHDAEILEVVRGVYDETGAALAAKHRVSAEEQAALAAASLAKFQDRTIVDSIERNARDPIRKLGPSDRLVGAARLVLQYGGRPGSLATAIAAALFYDEPSDPIALELARRRESGGIDAVLREVSGLEPGSELAALVKAKVEELRGRGLVPRRPH